MTNEQILELAKNHLTYESWNNIWPWKADTLQLLKFARTMYQEGLRGGYDDGYAEGIHDGGQ